MDELIGKLKSSIPVTHHPPIHPSTDPPTDDSPNPANGNTGTKLQLVSCLLLLQKRKEAKTHFGSPQMTFKLIS